MLTCKKELTSQPCQNGRMKIKVKCGEITLFETGNRDKEVNKSRNITPQVPQQIFIWLQWEEQKTNKEQIPILDTQKFTPFIFQRTSDPRREICSSLISLTTIPGRRRQSCNPRVTRREPGRSSGGGTSPASPRTRPGPATRRRRTGTRPPPCRPWRVSCREI